MFKDSNEQIIDWKLSLRLASGKVFLAEELLKMLQAELPKFRTNITAALQKNDLNALFHNVHKLHGSACYCGATKIMDITKILERVVKENDASQIQQLIPKLLDYIDKAIQELASGEYKK
jgi:two-component system, NarL family, sensor histidine kinase BarA